VVQQQTQMTSWRQKVRDWLAAVIQQQNRSFRSDFVGAADQLKGSFPKSFWVTFAGQVARPLAVAIVKSAFKNAAKDLGVTLNEETLGFLSELAVDALLAA
jgi:hypothetical protein